MSSFVKGRRLEYTGKSIVGATKTRDMTMEEEVGNKKDGGEKDGKEGGRKER